MRLCYIFSRYSREPHDGKQVQLFKLLPLLAERFSSVEVLGLARSPGNLEGKPWQGPSNVKITELVFPGSYDLQSVLCLWAGHAWLPWPGLGAVRRWVQAHDQPDVVFFFEGFSLAGLLRWPRRGRVFWGEVDSYLRRAHRFRRSGARRGLKGWLGIRAAHYLEQVGLRTAIATQVYSEADARFLRRVHGVGRTVGIPMLFEPAVNPPANLVARERARVLVWADASHPHLEASIRGTLDAVGPAASGRAIDYVFLINKNEVLKADIARQGWEVHSRISDLEAFVTGVDFVLLPDLSGTGIKNRVLFSLALGVCVLGTRVAWEGIPMTDGVHGAFLGKDLSGHALVTGLYRSAQRAEMSRAGRQFVQDFFSPEMLVRRWFELFGATEKAKVGETKTGNRRISIVSQ